MQAQLPAESLPLFERGLVRQLVRRQLRPARITRKEAAAFVVAFAWLPLALLGVADGTAFSGARIPFAKDVAVHVRLLVELPCLLLWGGVASRLVSRAIEYVDRSRLVAVERRDDYRALLASTRRACDTPIVPIVVFAIALAASWAELSGWVEMAHRGGESSWRAHHGTVTAAGLWFTLVARPILYAQLALWIFRFLLWSRVLFGLARMSRLVPAHPDSIGGLSPINAGHEAFVVLPLVIGGDLAAALANRIAHLGGSLSFYRGISLEIILGTTLLLLLPMLFFIPRLHRARVDALFAFGDAATIESRRIDAAIAGASREGVAPEAFKVHNHISESLERVRKMRLIALHRRTALLFLVAVTVPFLIAALTQVSPLELMRRVHGLTELEPHTIEP